MDWHPVHFDPAALRRDFAARRTEFEAERDWMARARLVKARIPDWPYQPKFAWIPLPTGNCQICRFFVSTDAGGPKCLYPGMTWRQFVYHQVHAVCPAFSVGVSDARAKEDYGALLRDLLRKLGVIEGDPLQRVEVLQNVAWTPWRSFQADNQSRHYLNLARQADAGVKPGEYEAGDFADDLGPIDTSE